MIKRAIFGLVLFLGAGVSVAQLPPPITPPATGSEIVTCVQAGRPRSCTTAEIAALAGTSAPVSANNVLAGPVSGGAALPTFRALVGSDIPAVNLAGTGAGGVSGTLSVSHGGTASTTPSGTALDNITGFSGTGFLSRTGAGSYSFGNTAVTQAVGNNSTQIATTAYADRATGAPVYNINTYGADPTGSTNSDSAWTAVMAAIGTGNGCVQFGAGTYKFSTAKAITLNSGAYQNFCMSGMGREITKVLFTGVSGGFHVSLTGQNSSIQVSDMSILTNQAGGGVGLSFINTGAFGGGSGNSSNINRVRFAGDDAISSPASGVHYWNTGIQDTSVSDVNIFQVDVVGPTNLTSLSGIGVDVLGQVTGEVYAVIINLTQCNFFGMHVGLQYGTYVQGVTVSQTNFQSGDYGISEPPGTLNTDQLTVIGSQFSNNTDDIVINLVSHVMVQNTVFFVNNSSESSIAIFGGRFINIIGNVFNGPASPAGNGVYVNGNISVNTAVISGNGFYHLTNGVWLTSGASGWNVQGNSYALNTTNVLDQGTGNSVGVATQ